jgi:murein L,D-transpeptidase YafK
MRRANKHGLSWLWIGLYLAVQAPAALAETGLRSHYPQADRILIVKGERKLYLLRAQEVLKSVDIALGLMPKGPKEREGDFRTPEGLYYVEAKNPDSDYFLALKVSYPNPKDVAHARSLGVDPGGQIMIHGQPNKPKYDERRYQGWDWTDGCIAVSNSDMVDIWLMTSESTPIEIRP